jgi:hypothetical protein
LDFSTYEIKGLPPDGLEIKPLTVFIGKQGTGKSLISQLIYFFYNLPYLIVYQQAADRKLISSQALTQHKGWPIICLNSRQPVQDKTPLALREEIAAYTGQPL